MKLLSMVLLCLIGTLPAQYPINWSVSAGVTGSPPATRENPGAASLTHFYKFGGRTGSSGGVMTNALWEFDGTTWVARTAEGAAGSPPERHQAGICWDFGRNVLVVFGGQSAAGTILDDTWEWDPVSNSWSQIMVSGPPARRFTSIAWDPSGLTGDIIMFGGLDAGNVHLNDTWAYVGGAGWVALNPTNVPAVRRQHSLVTRRDVGDVLLVGGQDASQPAPAKWRTDVWTWNGLDWTLIPTTNTPAAVVANQAVYDIARRRLVIVGGNGISGGSPTSQISEFDTATNDWTVYGYATPGTSDSVIGRISRYFAAYLPTTGRIYKVGGQNPAGIGANLTTTCEYGPGLSFPGNGADVSIDILINGTVSTSAVHLLRSGDIFSVNMQSPGGTLNGQPLSLAASAFVTGNPPAGLSIFGAGTDIWIDYPANFIWVLDGIFGVGPAAALIPGGLNLGPLTADPSLAGGSVIAQALAIAPGLNAFNLAISDAVELRFN